MAIYCEKCGARVGVTGPCRACKKQDAIKPGPVETLARLSIQSKRYQADPDYRDAVDAVLGHPVYDAAPELLAALTRISEITQRQQLPITAAIHEIADTAIRAAEAKP